MSDFKLDLEAGNLLLVDKPERWTSFDVCKKIKTILRKKYPREKIKVGHGGTLDPLATGLLIIAIGKKTKELHSIQGLPKCYEGIIKLGATTASYDREFEEVQVKSCDHLIEDEILKCRDSFLGVQKQIPPQYSAIKVNGQRSYAVARRGGKMELKAREVEISRFEFREINLPYLHFTVEVSKGTYIRSLAHDFGQNLNCGGYLIMLRRIRIGSFKLENAIGVSELSTILI